MKESRVLIIEVVRGDDVVYLFWRSLVSEETRTASTVLESIYTYHGERYRNK